jgi:hypothetical protein
MTEGNGSEGVVYAENVVESGVVFKLGFGALKAIRGLPLLWM